VRFRLLLDEVSLSQAPILGAESEPRDAEAPFLAKPSAPCNYEFAALATTPIAIRDKRQFKHPSLLLASDYPFSTSCARIRIRVP
jgi:hypothetical protein